jgi:hypothetical protein
LVKTKDTVNPYPNASPLPGGLDVHIADPLPIHFSEQVLDVPLPGGLRVLPHVLPVSPPRPSLLFSSETTSLLPFATTLAAKTSSQTGEGLSRFLKRLHDGFNAGPKILSSSLKVLEKSRTTRRTWRWRWGRWKRGGGTTVTPEWGRRNGGGREVYLNLPTQNLDQSRSENFREVFQAFRQGSPLFQVHQHFLQRLL